jgi:hypothetical protein
VQYSYFVRGLLYDIQEAFLLYREGRLSEEYWDTRQAIFSAYMQSVPARATYERDKVLGVLQPAFTEWADGYLQESTED